MPIPRDFLTSIKEVSMVPDHHQGSCLSDRIKKTMAFEIFKDFVVDEGKKGSKHSFFKVEDHELVFIENEIPIPKELKAFYLSIGYGYMFDSVDSFAINRIYKPIDFLNINLRRGYFEYDPTLEYYNLPQFKDLLIFFEIVEGNYLLIDKIDTGGKNAIFHINRKIANSLEEFLVMYDRNPGYFG